MVKRYTSCSLKPLQFASAQTRTPVLCAEWQSRARSPLELLGVPDCSQGAGQHSPSNERLSISCWSCVMSICFKSASERTPGYSCMRSALSYAVCCSACLLTMQAANTVYLSSQQTCFYVPIGLQKEISKWHDGHAWWHARSQPKQSKAKSAFISRLPDDSASQVCTSLL